MPYATYDKHDRDAPAACAMLATAMRAVRPGGLLLVAEGPKGKQPIREAAEAAEWSLP